MKRTKLCYILPDYDDSKRSRYFYIIEFLDALSKELDLFLFVETPSKVNNHFNFPVYYQKFHRFPLSFLERTVVFLYLRFCGYNNFYIHYSIFSSIIASLVSKMTVAQTYYWFCQMRRLYDHPWWDEFSYKLNLLMASFLVTCNAGMVDYFEKVYQVPKSKIKVVPLWINSQRFGNSVKHRKEIRHGFGLKNEKVVLFVHWLSVRKGSDKILPVLKLVSEKIPNVKFFVVGDGPQLDSLKKVASESGLSTKITFFGSVGNQEISKFYAASDLFFMPSKEEEFGRVLLEAMASGLPIVATNTVGPNSMMLPAQREMLVQWENVDGFSDKIAQILTNIDLYEKLRQDGYKVVKRYDIKKIFPIFSSITKR